MSNDRSSVDQQEQEQYFLSDVNEPSGFGVCAVPTPHATIDRILRQLIKAINVDESKVHAPRCCLWHVGIGTVESCFKKLKSPHSNVTDRNGASWDVARP